MLSKLLKSRRTPAFMPSIPDGDRIYAIGDVHGCLDELDRLLALIDADDARRGPAQTGLVFVGDLVDRGPASAQVVERVRRLAAERPRVRCLAGNHEEVFLQAIDGDTQALKLFCRIGGRETAFSYGLSPQDFERSDYAELAAALQSLVPPAHRAFLGKLEDMIVIGDYCFVHAGVRPCTALDGQRLADLRWIRETFLDHDQALAKMIVHGHTISAAVETRSHRIGIDTGAFQTGRLSALGLQGEQRWTLESRTGRAATAPRC